MSNKKNAVIHAAPGKETPESRRLFAITLITGDWKFAFSEEECNVMIAEALNDCVYNEGLEIAGYLITRRRVCLVLKIEYVHVNKMLQHFYEKMRKKILHQEHLIKEIHSPLFIKYPLQNENLVLLITGRQVSLPYYSPHLERLKSRIHNYNFCSALDYSGAKGPVVVSLLNAD
jgi:hypothetical protein